MDTSCWYCDGSNIDRDPIAVCCMRPGEECCGMPEPQPQPCRVCIAQSRIAELETKIGYIQSNNNELVKEQSRMAKAYHLLEQERHDLRTELARVRECVEKAPHAHDCGKRDLIGVTYAECTCWKAALRDGK